MSDWNSTLYLKFKKERTQPAIDLVNKVRSYTPNKIVDIGCVPGNSTEIVKTTFPNSDILGIDNSQDMIYKAQKEHPELTFQLCDINDLHCGYDMFFSNACLQWIPNHTSLLPKLINKLNDGGILAVQIPMNQNEPLFRIIDDVAARFKWNFENINFHINDTLQPDEYYDILSDCSSSFQLWETTYCHALPSHQALLDWIKGSRLRPYLNILDDKNKLLFENEILHHTIKAYPPRKDGNILLHFRRFFFIAIK